MLWVRFAKRAISWRGNVCFRKSNRASFSRSSTPGAYGFMMASNYNTRPRAAEVMVDGKRSYLIRRRETLDDLLQYDEIPAFLKKG